MNNLYGYRNTSINVEKLVDNITKLHFQPVDEVKTIKTLPIAKFLNTIPANSACDHDKLLKLRIDPVNDYVQYI